jgi:hypothetical protein
MWDHPLDEDYPAQATAAVSEVLGYDEAQVRIAGTGQARPLRNPEQSPAVCSSSMQVPPIT